MQHIPVAVRLADEDEEGPFYQTMGEDLAAWSGAWPDAWPTLAEPGGATGGLRPGPETAARALRGVAGSRQLA